MHVSVHPNKMTTLSKYRAPTLSGFLLVCEQDLVFFFGLWAVVPTSWSQWLTHHFCSPPCTRKQRTTLVLMNDDCFTSDSFFCLRTFSHCRCSLQTHSPPPLACIGDLWMMWFSLWPQIITSLMAHQHITEVRGSTQWQLFIKDCAVTLTAVFLVRTMQEALHVVEKGSS